MRIVLISAGIKSPFNQKLALTSFENTTASAFSFSHLNPWELYKAFKDVHPNKCVFSPINVKLLSIMRFMSKIVPFLKTWVKKRGAIGPMACKIACGPSKLTVGRPAGPAILRRQ